MHDITFTNLAMLAASIPRHNETKKEGKEETYLLGGDELMMLNDL